MREVLADFFERVLVRDDDRRCIGFGGIFRERAGSHVAVVGHGGCGSVDGLLVRRLDLLTLGPNQVGLIHATEDHVCVRSGVKRVLEYLLD